MVGEVVCSLLLAYYRALENSYLKFGGLLTIMISGSDGVSEIYKLLYLAADHNLKPYYRTLII